MKSTGIVRKVDELGRIVLPIEMRRTLGVDNRDPIEMFLDGKNIILRKYAPGAEIKKGLSITGSEAANSRSSLRRWLSANGLM